MTFPINGRLLGGYMFCKVLIVPEEISEEGFLEWCRITYKVEGFRITKSRLFDIQQAITKLEDYSERWAYYSELINRIQILKEQRRNGLPDFFLYTPKSVLLCEFKGKGDKLSQEQIFWFEQNKDLPLAIAMAFNPEKLIKDEKNEQVPEFYSTNQSTEESNEN